jgi:hypothetical protein
MEKSKEKFLKGLAVLMDRYRVPHCLVIYSMHERTHNTALHTGKGEKDAGDAYDRLSDMIDEYLRRESDG